MNSFFFSVQLPQDFFSFYFNSEIRNKQFLLDQNIYK